tara:strand:- start:54993 stop:55769 length:777 start_codon:yes stop_codon:yes gene_type:complete
MNNQRKNSIEDIKLSNWTWEPFLKKVQNELKIFKPKPYPISLEYLDKKSSLETLKKTIELKASTWACSTNKFRQVRAACIDAKNLASVFNLLFTPLNNFELPFFGADFVTLPNGHLLALDLQPALKSDKEHTEKVWDKLIPIHTKWQSLLPAGGPIPKDAQEYFSPGFLWTRIPLSSNSDEIIKLVIKPAFDEYLSLYLNLAKEAEEVDFERSMFILKGQKSYMDYRAYKDPARSMLQRFFGNTWTEEYIKKVLFDLC